MSLPDIARRACAVALLLPLAAIAQSGPTLSSRAPEPLRAAVISAWTQHPALRAADARRAAASARLDAARQPLHNPSLDLAYDREGTDRTNTFGLSMPLDINGKRRARADAATSRVMQSNAEAHVTRRNFVRSWLENWAEWQTADARVRVGERRLQLLGRFQDLAKTQFAAGDISGLERDLAQLSRAEAQAEQARLLAERAQAEAALRALGSNPEAVASLDVGEMALPVAKLTDADVDRLPDVQAAYAAADAAARDIEVAKRNRLGDPVVGFNTGRLRLPGGVSDTVLGVSVSIPLNIRNGYRAEVRAAQAEADVARAEAEQVRLAFASNQTRAAESYRAAKSAWDDWQDSRGTDVERRASLLERSWREGELSTTDYLLQLNQTLDTQQAGAALQAQVWKAYVEYLDAADQLERWVGLESSP